MTWSMRENIEPVAFTAYTSSALDFWSRNSNEKGNTQTIDRESINLCGITHSSGAWCKLKALSAL